MFIQVHSHVYKTVGVMLVAGCSQKTSNPEKWEEG